MRRSYLRKLIDSPLMGFAGNERVCLKVPNTASGFARCCHCGFDEEEGLWFAGAYNAELDALVELYGVDESTSDDARALMQMALDTPDRGELLEKLLDWYVTRGIPVRRPDGAGGADGEAKTTDSTEEER